MPLKGIDYAFAPHPSPSQIKAAGMHWVGRYVSSYGPNDTNGKNLVPAEQKALHAAGLEIILFAEEGASRMLGGSAAGIQDAKHFEAVVKGLGMSGAVMFSCADWDAAPGQQTQISAYLDGAASVVGRDRTGIYGSFYVVRRCLDGGKARYACQTVAWSGGQWEPRAHIRQHLQVRVGGVSVDLDEAMRDDFGQWPRPPKPVQAPAKPARRTADGRRSLRVLAHAEGTSVNRALWLMAHDPDKVKKGDWGALQKEYLGADDFDRPAPKGMVYWVG